LAVSKTTDTTIKRPVPPKTKVETPVTCAAIDGKIATTAKKNAPTILFIDEIDAICRARSSGMLPAHDARETTLNQISVEMDGFAAREPVLLIAPPNRGA